MAMSKFLETLQGFKLREKLLLFYIASLPIMKTAIMPIFKEKLQFSELIFLAILACCLGDFIKMIKFLSRQAISAASAALALAAAFSLIRNGVSLSSVIECSGLIYLLSLFLLCILIIRSESLFWFIIKAWIAVSLLVVCLGFLAWGTSLLLKDYYHNPFVLFYAPFSSVISFPRIISTFRNPNMLLTYLHITLGMIIPLFLLAKNRNKKIICISVIFLLLLAVILTGSRHILGVLFTLFLLALFLKKEMNKKGFWAFILGLFFIAQLFITAVFTRWTIYPVKAEKIPASKQLSISFSYADSIYNLQQMTAISIIKDHPFFGIGPGKFPDKFMEYTLWEKYADTLKIEEIGGPYKSDPHSTYLGIFAETGIFGLLSFFLIIYFIFVNLSETLKKPASNLMHRYFGLSFLAIVSGFLLNAFIIEIISMRHFWVLLALIVAQRNIIVKQANE